jgi:hypothetical protein
MTQAGIMLKGLQAAGLHPLPENEFAMQGSVRKYWTGLKDMGVAYQNLMPAICRVSNRLNRFTHHNCAGDYDIKNKGREILKRYAHVDVWQQWENVRMLPY